MDIDADCIWTLEQAQAELITLEATLAARYNLTGDNITDQLIELCRNDGIVEDEVVARWVEVYINVRNW